VEVKQGSTEAPTSPYCNTETKAKNKVTENMMLELSLTKTESSKTMHTLTQTKHESNKILTCLSDSEKDKKKRIRYMITKHNLVFFLKVKLMQTVKLDRQDADLYSCILF
jgi:hypothetical protein